MGEVDVGIIIGLVMIALIIAIIQKSWYVVVGIMVVGILVNFFYETDNKEACIAKGGKPPILGDCFEITVKKIPIK